MRAGPQRAKKSKKLQELYIAATSILRYGRHLSADSRRSLRRYARSGVGVRASREDLMIIYGLAAVLALFLFGYLLYALLRAEQF